MFDVEIIKREDKIQVRVNGKCARRAKSLESSRMLFRWKDSITGRPLLIKLDTLIHDYHSYNRQSSDEIELYKQIKPRHKKFFPELIAFGESNGIGFVVQPLYKLTSFDPYDSKDEAAANKVLTIGAKYNLTDLTETNNVGKLPNGQGLIYDFGV